MHRFFLPIAAVGALSVTAIAADLPPSTAPHEKPAMDRGEPEAAGEATRRRLNAQDLEAMLAHGPK